MEVGKKAVRGVIFVTLSNNIIFILSFLANNIILARLLPVEAFGQFALATFFVNMVGRVRELGFDYAIVHSREPVQKIGSVYITLQLGFSIVIAALSVPISLVISEIYGPEIGMATALLGMTSVFMNLFNSLNALYDKELRFKESTTILMISTAISLAGMVLMGFLGFGLWSLVLGGVPGYVIGLGLLFRYLPIRFRITWDPEIVKWFFAFGPWWHWLISATASLLVMQFDNYLVGGLVGITALGYYSRAYSWATMPTARITAIISKVAFPVYSKLQDNKESLSKAFHLTLSTIVMLTLPLSFLSLLVIREAVVLLVGPKWLDMIPIFQYLVFYMILRPIFDDSGALLTAVGKPRIINNAQLIQAALMLTVTTSCVYLFGGIGAAMGVGIVTAAGVLYVYSYLTKVVTISFTRIFVPPIIATAVATTLTFVVKKYFLLSLDELMIIVITSLLFLTSYVIVLFLIRGRKISQQWHEFRTLVSR